MPGIATADSLISRCQLDKEHAERVRDTAIQAFTQLQPAWRLPNATVARSCAMRPLLHEIRLCIEYKKAPQHAAYIIDNNMPGFTPPMRPRAYPGKQGAVTWQAIRLAGRIPGRISLIPKGTVPQFMLQADEDALTAQGLAGRALPPQGQRAAPGARRWAGPPARPEWRPCARFGLFPPVPTIPFAAIIMPFNAFYR